MGWIQLVIALVPLIEKLIEFLENRKKSGRPLTDRQQKRLNRLYGLVNRVRSALSACGCVPEE